MGPKSKTTKTRKDSKAQGNAAPLEPGWIDAGGSYLLSLQDGKLACRSPKGALLSSIPKAVNDGAAAENLRALRDYLQAHERECIETVEAWMLRSLPVPRGVLEQVWPDESYRRALENTVVMALADDGAVRHDAGGLFRGVDGRRGIGVVDLDGETSWLDAEAVLVPHPILLRELDDYRKLLAELGITQGIPQLMRETWSKAAGIEDGATAIGDFADAKFDMLMHAVSRCRSLGYRARGGYATCPVWEGGAVLEARYWIGADDPESATYTGDLGWVDGRERPVALAAVTPVAYSEGMRMASGIYAGRKVEKEAGNE